ncbi:electron transfer flavoprotein alpha subunit [Silvibacterium bohemicum]|uniref:Electron transfer flavoprotein alpha subunit n=1 Tax=Silvibacterium bohemicum TaxID=1577686 RepID=A0A841JTI9_9BACT|nr:electron transfer flavoprotein subunit alpha/FixB family protein [Silvibacterium bohemicum]MBB6144646.1 electron transfer flavoprotein alpha subunit [Silvibacterium bohemicum]
MILIAAEHANGKLSRSTYEIVTCARELGREGPIAILILGKDVVGAAAEAALVADQVLVADRAQFAQYDAELWSAAVAQIASEGEAHTVLIGGSRSGREYSPRVAVRLDAALLEDVTSLRFAKDAVSAQHYTYLARVTEKIETPAKTIVATVKPGSFAAAAPGSNHAEQFDVDLNLPERRVKVIGRSLEKTARISLSEADIVVAGGRGVGSADGFTKLVEGLADQLGAAVGATRAIVDAGWRPYSEQVGQTGKTVQPKAYIAIGISGAVQHLSGMSKSKIIVAINKDGDAPIFKVADYGIVGDVQQIVPALIDGLRK